jgi:aspartyl-tRNA(Asn)/glutamyl-tRNA(Gln) amidotransferase subunit A
MSAREVVFESVHELGFRLRRRELSAVDLAGAFLDRIDALNPRLKAFITVTRHHALQRARRADAELRSGRDLGALHGVPYALKDVIATKGILTTNGSRASAEWVPSFDATVEERLASAGGVLVGKLNLWEFAMVGSCFGEVLNPWSVEHSAGGSSSGAGAAVGARLVPLAIGTDTGGSIRIPAAYCGVVGFRPTYGRVSRYGVTANAWSVDTVGPLTSTVADAGIALTAIAGADRRDRTCSTRPVAVPPAASKDIRGMRVGVPEAHFFEDIDAQVDRAVRHSIDVLAQMGARVVPIRIPHASDAALLRTLHLAESASLHERRLKEQSALLGESFRQRLERGWSYAAPDYVKALRLRSVLMEEVADAFTRCDVFVTPSARNVATRVNVGTEPTTQPSAVPVGAHTFVASMTGIPSLALPCGLTAGRPALPISMLLHAPPFEESALIRTGQVFQMVTDWHRQVPSL